MHKTTFVCFQNSEVGRDLLFSDGDSLTQNSNTVFEIVNDPLDVLRSDCRAFEVNMSGLKSSAYNCSKLLIFFKHNHFQATNTLFYFH